MARKSGPEMYARRVIFRPYWRSKGPAFTLTLWDAEETTRDGHRRMAYRLTKSGAPGKGAEVIFEGDDFHLSPLHAVDSDAAVRAIMGFLTLKPGDTDAERFEGYSPRQEAFATHHAEAVALEVAARFGED